MLTRPFLPFRIRPVRSLKTRPAPPLPVDVFAALDDLKPLSVKAERKSVKGLPVATVRIQRVCVRGMTRLG